jgi:hypothetical protein
MKFFSLDRVRENFREDPVCYCIVRRTFFPFVIIPPSSLEQKRPEASIPCDTGSLGLVVSGSLLDRMSWFRQTTSSFSRFYWTISGNLGDPGCTFTTGLTGSDEHRGFVKSGSSRLSHFGLNKRHTTNKRNYFRAYRRAQIFELLFGCSLASYE